MLEALGETPGQERLKTGDDAVYKVSHMIERFKNRLTSDNLGLAERDVNSELECLVRLSVICKRGNSHDFIALFQGFASFVEGDLPPRLNNDLPPLEDRGDGKDESVLVVAVKLVDVPERIVPSRARLYLAHDCFRAGAHLLYFSLTNG